MQFISKKCIRDMKNKMVKNTLCMSHSAKKKLFLFSVAHITYKYTKDTHKIISWKIVNSVNFILV
jgi:hypothetical protein